VPLASFQLVAMRLLRPPPWLRLFFLAALLSFVERWPSWMRRAYAAAQEASAAALQWCTRTWQSASVSASGGDGGGDGGGDAALGSGSEGETSGGGLSADNGRSSDAERHADAADTQTAAETRTARALPAVQEALAYFLPVSAMGAAALVAKLRAASSTPDEQVWCCAALSLLKLRGDAAADALRAIVVALRRRRDHAELQWSGCHLLENLAAVDEGDNRLQAGAAGAIDIVVLAMRVHLADAVLQNAGCQALACIIANTAENRVIGGAAGAISAALAAMRAHAADAGVQEHGCFALAALTLQNDENEAEACAAGAVEAAITAMTTHFSEVRVQHHGCSVLSNIARDADNRKHALHGAGAVLAAMRSCAADAVLQKFGCRALGNMLRDLTSQDTNDANTLTRQASAAVVAALHGHLADVELLFDGCSSLACIATSDVGQLAAGVAGGIEAAVAALVAQPADAELQFQGCCALEAICKDVAEHQQKAGAAGGIEAVVRALRAHTNVADLQYKACDTLRIMVSGNVRNQIIAALAGGVEAVVATTRASQTGMQQAGCLTLSILILANDGNQRRAVAAGGIEVAVAAMKSWHSSPNAGCSLLQLLLPPGNDDLAVCAGALEALQHHISSRTTGRTDDVKVEKFLNNLLTTLQAAAQRHDAHPCADAGCRRCAHLRERGAMCALPGCCALRRESGKRLQRCIACRTARYCCEAHLHDDWARHGPECAALQMRREEEEETGAAAAQ
jgi:hypothetical protein